jgi:HlyD family secretion protein
MQASLTPTLQGRVDYVSADRLAGSGSESAYYVAQVRVSPQELERLGSARLLPGMPGEVYVRTASRTVFEYLLDPIVGFLNRSMREQ